MSITNELREVYAKQGITRDSTIKRLEKIKKQHLFQAKKKPVVAHHVQRFNDKTKLTAQA